jgi:hypothetical protein
MAATGERTNVMGSIRLTAIVTVSPGRRAYQDADHLAHEHGQERLPLERLLEADEEVFEHRRQ